MTAKQKTFPPYFGKWGGFFVPDPLTPALDDFASLAEEKITQGDFKSQLELALSGMGVAPVDPKPVPNSRDVYSVQSTVLHFVAAGYALLAQASGRELVCGAYSEAQASILTTICKKLSVPLVLWLNVATGADEKLVKALEDGGVKVNLDSCRTLFDEPDMYAFQKFIADPEHYLWATLNTVTGPYPYPAMTGYFAHFYTDKAVETANSLAAGKPVTIAAAGYPGFSMAGLLFGDGKEKVKLVTYEPPVEKEREECYLGAYTRAAVIGKKDFILSPMLVNAWESDKVERFYTCAPYQFFAEKKGADFVLVLED